MSRRKKLEAERDQGHWLSQAFVRAQVSTLSESKATWSELYFKRVTVAVMVRIDYRGQR